jgi:acyl carrier protein
VTPDEIKTRVIEVLATIAPELDPAALAPDANLRDQLDVDSMDFLNFVIGLHKAFGVEVPESDYRRLQTLEGCVGYLAAKLKAA